MTRSRPRPPPSSTPTSTVRPMVAFCTDRAVRVERVSRRVRQQARDPYTRGPELAGSVSLPAGAGHRFRRPGLVPATQPASCWSGLASQGRAVRAAAKVGLVPQDREESNRVLGMPRRNINRHATQDEEQGHVFGVPMDWYGQVDLSSLRSLLHPIKAWKRWTLIRRLGPYAPDDED